MVLAGSTVCAGCLKICTGTVAFRHSCLTLISALAFVANLPKSALSCTTAAVSGIVAKLYALIAADDHSIRTCAVAIQITALTMKTDICTARHTTCTTVCGIAHVVDTSASTCSQARRAFVHTASTCTHLCIGTRLSARAAVFRVGHDVYAVPVAVGQTRFTGAEAGSPVAYQGGVARCCTVATMVRIAVDENMIAVTTGKSRGACISTCATVVWISGYIGASSFATGLAILALLATSTAVVIVFHHVHTCPATVLFAGFTLGMTLAGCTGFTFRTRVSTGSTVVGVYFRVDATAIAFVHSRRTCVNTHPLVTGLAVGACVGALSAMVRVCLQIHTLVATWPEAIIAYKGSIA